MITPFSERLRAVMGARGKTMKDVAKACGVSTQAVFKWRNDETLPSTSSLLEICKLCQCSMEWLLAQQNIDFESTEDAPQGRHAKYWVREAISELVEEGFLKR